MGDYSLLVGVSPSNGSRESSWSRKSEGLKLVHGNLARSDSVDAPPAACTFQFGIIDYLQRWTPKKVAAHWLKKPTLGCCHEIDTEPPTIYCARFYKYLVGKIVQA